MFRLLMSDGRGGVRVAQVPRWAVWAGVAGIAAIGLLVLTLSLTVMLVLAPLAIGAGLLGRWRLNKALREAAQAGRADPFARRPPDGVIDVEYKVISDPRDPRR